MGLHVGARVGLAQQAGHGQLHGRAGGRKAHGDGKGLAALVVPAVDQVDAIALGLGHVVAQAVGGVAVHQHLAGDQAHALCMGRLEQGVRTDFVHGGEHDRAGGAMRPQGRQETLRAQVRHLGVGVALFGGEGVGVEPVEQGGAKAGDHVELRTVHMGVDEAGHQQATPVVFLGDMLPAWGHSLGGRLHGVDAAVFDEDEVIRAPAHARGLVRQGKARVGGEVEQVGAQHAAHRRVRGAGFTCHRHRIRGVHRGRQKIIEPVTIWDGRACTSSDRASFAARASKNGDQAGHAACISSSS